MHTTLKGAIFALGTLALTGTAAAQFGPPPEPWSNNRAVLTANLNLGNSGSFTGLLNPEMTRMCYILNAGAVSQPTAARILSGTPGESGSVVLELENPANGSSAGCVDVQAELARAMVDNPAGHYLAIQTAAYPEGFVRVPLTAQHPSAPPAG